MARFISLLLGVLALGLGITVMVSWGLGSQFAAARNVSLITDFNSDAKGNFSATIQHEAAGRRWHTLDGAYLFGPVLADREYRMMTVSFEAYQRAKPNNAKATEVITQRAPQTTLVTLIGDFQQRGIDYEKEVKADSPIFAGLMLLAFFAGIAAVFRRRWISAMLFLLAAIAPWFLGDSGTPALLSLWLLLGIVLAVFVKKSGVSTAVSPIPDGVLLPRSEAEIALYIGMQRCDCSSGTRSLQTEDQQMDGWVARTLSGPCEGCGKTRTFRFGWVPQLAHGDPTTSYGEGPSSIIDPGQFGVFSDEIASRDPASSKGMSAQELQNATSNLRQAIVGLEEICKFYTSDAPDEDVPAELFTSSVGRAYRNSLPGQFRRGRINARLEAYLDLEGKHLARLAEMTAGGPQPIDLAPQDAMTIDIIYHSGQLDRAMFDASEATRLLNDFLGWANNRTPVRGTYYYIGSDFVSRQPMALEFADVQRVSTV